MSRDLVVSCMRNFVLPAKTPAPCWYPNHHNLCGALQEGLSLESDLKSSSGQRPSSMWEAQKLTIYSEFRIYVAGLTGFGYKQYKLQPNKKEHHVKLMQNMICT